MSRLFIVGTGPSLNDFNLDVLENETSYAVGRIQLAYPNTIWRPQVWVVADKSGNPNIVWDVLYHLKQGEQCVVSTSIVQLISPLPWQQHPRADEFADLPSWWEYPNIEPIMDCFHYERFEPTKWHFPHICTYGGAAHVAVQYAVQHGFDEIYTIGLDGRYEKGNLHFTDDYELEEWEDDYIEVENRKLSISRSIFTMELDRRGIKYEKILSQDRLLEIISE